MSSPHRAAVYNPLVSPTKENIAPFGVPSPSQPARPNPSYPLGRPKGTSSQKRKQPDSLGVNNPKAQKINFKPSTLPHYHYPPLPPDSQSFFEGILQTPQSMCPMSCSGTLCTGLY